MLIPIAVGSLVFGTQSPASAVTGCQSSTGGSEYNSWTWATCSTSAPGIYFRAWIHCKHVDPYGRVTYNYRYSRWDYQGTSTGKLWAWCDIGDVYSSYGSAPGGVETSN
jgi:hypothetical protein